MTGDQMIVLVLSAPMLLFAVWAMWMVFTGRDDGGTVQPSGEARQAYMRQVAKERKRAERRARQTASSRARSVDGDDGPSV